MFPLRTVVRTSQLTGKVSEMQMRFDLTDYTNWQNGTVIQNALPYLNAEEREFLLTGITPDEWEDTYGEED